MATRRVSLSSQRSRSVRRFYRLMAWIYDPLRRWWSRRTAAAESELDSLFAENIRASSRILELGPGTGVNLARLYRVSPEFRSYLGIDLSKEMLSRAQRVAPGDALDLSTATRRKGKPIDFEDIRFG